MDWDSDGDVDDYDLALTGFVIDDDEEDRDPRTASGAGCCALPLLGSLLATGCVLLVAYRLVAQRIL